jgi:hypothetical protein
MADEFYMDTLRKLGGNSGPEAFANLSDLIDSGRLTGQQLRALACAFRSLHQKAWDKSREIDEAMKRRAA